MNPSTALPLLLVMVIIVMIGSVVFRSPRQNLQSALTEGAIWGTSSFVAFGAEFLLLIRV